MEAIFFVDTTLRDGEQSPGIAFTIEEKVQIACLLDQVGVYEIEAGIPIMGKLEMDAVYQILAKNLKARVTTWNRATLKDVQASLECGAQNLHISAPVSDIHIQYKLNRSRKWVLDNLRRVIHYAKSANCTVSVGAEDASRADMNFLISFARLARQEGAHRLRFADTLGQLDPFTTREKMALLINESGLAVEMHAHNDFGMATANALAAQLAGAQYLSTTILGLGERAGNTSFEEVIRVLEQVGGYKLNVNQLVLEELTRYVLMAAYPFRNDSRYGDIPGRFI